MFPTVSIICISFSRPYILEVGLEISHHMYLRVLSSITESFIVLLLLYLGLIEVWAEILIRVETRMLCLEKSHPES